MAGQNKDRVSKLYNLPDGCCLRTTAVRPQVSVPKNGRTPDQQLV
jgi:hypothetical protein